ncbi:hypothetical protein Y032_0003g1369 [Ancylostoma ceylanicum]|nr:hypothetical protein Y032_0003g1369 [Ancylostoma ceylanicum]
MPPVTRAYTTACVLTTLAVQLDFITPFHLYFNWELIVKRYQFWRLLTSFCFFGSFGFSFMFNMIFTYRYCMMLEEGSFRGRRADFVYMFLLGGGLMSDARIHLRKIFDEDRSTRHEILNEENARLPRGRKRVRLSCDCDPTGPHSSSYSRTRVSRMHPV